MSGRVDGTSRLVMRIWVAPAGWEASGTEGGPRSRVGDSCATWSTDARCDAVDSYESSFGLVRGWGRAVLRKVITVFGSSAAAIGRQLRLGSCSTSNSSWENPYRAPCDFAVDVRVIVGEPLVHPADLVPRDVLVAHFYIKGKGVCLFEHAAVAMWALRSWADSMGRHTSICDGGWRAVCCLPVSYRKHAGGDAGGAAACRVRRLPPSSVGWSKHALPLQTLELDASRGQLPRSHCKRMRLIRDTAASEAGKAAVWAGFPGRGGAGSRETPVSRA